ncbi:vWA domain-containing protein [Salinactinospora qingdaonensis]|uniref:VWA domain-containing protein n=1 Tax=Salinactinospora qingdaonensis TaxID=702744 RepID=A0ABP7FLF7_9ACTN
MASTLQPREVTETMLGFVRTLRAAGVAADTGRAQAFFAALDTLDVTDPARVYWAGRVTLCSAAADLEHYDACFAHYFSAHPFRSGRSPAPFAVSRPAVWPAAGRRDSGGDVAAEEHAAAASDVEVLRSRDIATLTVEERAEVARLLAALATHRPRRRTRRTAPARHGRLDRARTIRASLAHGGEPLRLLRRDRATRPRRVVLLVDISGSMSPYADALLRLAHALARGHPGSTEVFSVGTRLTRLSREMRLRDPDAALRAAGSAIPDWSGGTRLGTELKEFLDSHGQRGMARGALVLIASDGWERGDVSLLGAQMARLGRLAYRVVWVNPHKAQPGYQPLAAGMRAALPHIDDFVSGHSLDALERLATVVTGGRADRAREGAPRA